MTTLNRYSLVRRYREEVPFLEAMRRDHSEIHSRLTYADWLAERGDPLADLIHLAIALQSAGEHSLVDLMVRWRRLHTRFFSAWRDRRGYYLGAHLMPQLGEFLLREWFRRRPAVKSCQLHRSWVSLRLCRESRLISQSHEQAVLEMPDTTELVVTFDDSLPAYHPFDLPNICWIEEIQFSSSTLSALN